MRSQLLPGSCRYGGEAKGCSLRGERGEGGREGGGREGGEREGGKRRGREVRPVEARAKGGPPSLSSRGRCGWLSA